MITLAGCIILNEQGELLLLHRNTAKRTQWETPGGKIEDGEEPAETAIREIAEETSLEIDIVRELGRKEFQQGDVSMLYIWFLATIIHGTPTITEPDTFDDIRYFSWEELERTEGLSANTQNLLAAYLAKEISL